MVQVKRFPRGGASDIKRSKNLFLKQKNSKYKKQKSEVKAKQIKLSSESTTLSMAQNLTYSSLYEGMIILGRIFKVTDYYAVVSLPGQIRGILKSTDISDSYTNLLKNITDHKDGPKVLKSILDIYKKGDYVVCYVKELHPDNKVSLSLKPCLINQNLNPKNLKRNSRIVMSVNCEEDHGYTMETGIKNLRAFLSIKDIEDNGLKLCCGKQVICSVKHIDDAKNVSIVKISTKPKDVDVIEANIKSLDSLFPGTNVNLTVTKVLKNGLEVDFADKSVGYINQLYLHKALSSFQKGQQLIGTLLYVLPTVKIAFFSLQSCEQENTTLSIGDTIPNAKVVSLGKEGILLQLTNDVQGFVPIKLTGKNYNNIDSKFCKDSVHKCKIIRYDLLAKLYICSMEKKLLSEMHLNNTNNIQPGNILNVTISKIDKNSGYIRVLADSRVGTVPPDQVSESKNMNMLKEGQIISARVLESSDELILTLKKSLVESKLPILSKLEDAKVGSIHEGSVVKITDQGVLVRFFGNVKGWIPKSFLVTHNASQQFNILPGRTIKTVIKNINKQSNIILAPLNKENHSLKYKVGDTVEGVVIDSSSEGVYLELKDTNENITAFLPAAHMSPCYEVGSLLAAKTISGELLSATVFSVIPNLILSTTFAPQTAYDINDLKVGDSLLCSIKNLLKNPFQVLLPIKKRLKYGNISTSHIKDVESIHKHQILCGKIIKIDKMQNIFLTIELSKVLKSVTKHEKMMVAVDLLCSYLNKIKELSKNIYYTSKSISKVRIGQNISGTVESIEEYGLILKLDSGLKGIVRNNNFCGNFKVHDKVEGMILWIDYPQENIEITLIPDVIKIMNLRRNESVEIPRGLQLRGEIVLVTNWFVLVVLKGQCKGTLVALPVRRHLNDITPVVSCYQVGDKVKCYCVLNKDEFETLLPICILKSVFEITNSTLDTQFKAGTYVKCETESMNSCNSISSGQEYEKNKSTVSITRGNYENENEENNRSIKLLNNEKKTDLKVLKKEKCNKRKRMTHDTIQTNINESAHMENTLNVSDCAFKWDSFNLNTTDDVLSESEHEEIEETKNAKKRKLTTVNSNETNEDKELLGDQNPQTIDYFDRLVLSNPNNSRVWIQYIAYHLQATEIEKARIVIKRALKMINFREEIERLNIWQAWLNLESRFGSLESLNEVFQEAVKTNNSDKIYEHMLSIHTNANRQIELEKIINTMIVKFKQNLDVWVKCGAALLKTGLKNKSRNLLQKAMQSLPSNQHVNLVIKFAQLENKYGELERAQTLFEQILSMYPKRTDVWSSYVDLLVKSENIEDARSLLQRAIAKELPPKKMKILFKKYIKFEEMYGTPTTIADVRELAIRYVEQQRSNRT